MRYLLCLVGLWWIAAPARAEFVYLNGNTAIQENFNGLASSGVNLAWSNDTTLDGWYSTSSIYHAGTGSSSGRTLYSFGSANDSDRALGIVSQGTSTDPEFAFALRNETGQTLTSFTVQFDGEQWRRSTTNTSAPQTLNFGYRTSTTLGTINAAAYTDVANLSFTSPTFSLPGGPLDGNDSANRVSGITDTITGLQWQNGQYLWLRWQNLQNAEDSRHGLAIDNFSFSASNLSSVPEPSSIILIFSTSGFAVFRRKRRW
jgi:hypothetical protein